MMSDALSSAPNPRVLFCCLSSPAYYRQPLFSTREVFCGPDCATMQDEQGFRSIKTPAGEFDLAAVLRQLPAAQRPDLVVVKTDASRRNFARNLDAFDCPKVLIVGDTHHMQTPVRSLLTYASMESFDRIIADHTRHHAHYFIEAGFENVHWIPAVDYALRLREISPEPVRPLTFVGQASRFHPYRRHVLESIKAAGLPLEMLRASPEDTPSIYAQSQITLNCSLNGDLNLRVFEALGAGGFLITDALTPESGLDLLFEDGRHLIFYRSPAELAEKIRYYLDHPAEAMTIRTAGQQELLARHHPDVKIRQFYDLVFDGIVDPVLDLGRDRRAIRPLALRGALLERIALYEAVQQVHRTATLVPVYLPDEGFCELAEDLQDLPRVAILRHSDLPKDAADAVLDRLEQTIGDEPLLLLPWSNAEEANRLLCRLPGRRLLVPSRNRRAAKAYLDQWGFTPDGGVNSPLFTLREPLRAVARLIDLGHRKPAAALLRSFTGLAANAAAAFEAARLCHLIGEHGTEQEFLTICIGFDRNHQRALLAYARIAEMRNRADKAYLAVAERNRLIGPGPEEAAREETLSMQCGDSDTVRSYRSIVGRSKPANERRRILVVTNLFPPQEMGGYGRKLWEFSAELLRRGHDVRVLTADAAYLYRPGDTGSEDIEAHVRRELQLYGAWRNGKTVVETDRAGALSRIRANAETVARMLDETGADVCLFGNMDFLGTDCLEVPLRRGIPIVHSFGNSHPGFDTSRTPDSPRYCAAPASGWLAEHMAASGYRFQRQAIVYPGARVDYYYRHFMPVQDKLRILFAGLVLPYKGPQVLINALSMLHRQGIDFECVIAGDSTSDEFVGQLKDFIRKQGMEAKFRFPGFLDRSGLARAINATNVVVFPSNVNETFGITQVEGMAGGLAVVTSGTGGAQEVVRDGVDGLVFQRGDHEDLARKLKGLLDDRQRWRDLALAGRRRAVEFAIPRSVDVIERAFTEMLAER